MKSTATQIETFETFETLNDVDYERLEPSAHSWIDTECGCPEHCLRDHDNDQ